MGVPGKTRGHSIDIVLGGSRKNRTTMAGFNKALVNEAKDPNTDMNEGFKKAVLGSTAVNRAGTPTRMMNNTMMTSLLTIHHIVCNSQQNTHTGPSSSTI